MSNAAEANGSLEYYPLITSTFLRYPFQYEMKENNYTLTLQEHIQSDSTTLYSLSIRPTSKRRDSNYVTDYILIGNFLVMVFIPIITLMTLNFKLYR